MEHGALCPPERVPPRPHAAAVGAVAPDAGEDDGSGTEADVPCGGPGPGRDGPVPLPARAPRPGLGRCDQTPRGGQGIIFSPHGSVPRSGRPAGSRRARHPPVYTLLDRTVSQPEGAAGLTGPYTPRGTALDWSLAQRS